VFRSGRYGFGQTVSAQATMAEAMASRIQGFKKRRTVHLQDGHDRGRRAGPKPA